jgi:hypothetical protein
MFVIGMRQNQENVANNHIVPLPMLSRDILMYRNNIIFIINKHVHFLVVFLYFTVYTAIPICLYSIRCLTVIRVRVGL